MHPTGGHASWLGYVMRDALHEHTPSNTGDSVPSIDLKADVHARRYVQLRARRGSKNHDALIEEVIDREDERPRLAIDDGDAAKVVRSQEANTLSIRHDLELPRLAIHVDGHGSRNRRPLISDG